MLPIQRKAKSEALWVLDLRLELKDTLTLDVLKIHQFEESAAAFLVLNEIEKIDCMEVYFQTNNGVAALVDLDFSDIRACCDFLLVDLR